MNSRGQLMTEKCHPMSAGLDRLSVQEAFELINNEDATIAAAVAEARSEICQAIDLVVDSLRNGGRLIYVGAGTSGRLGVLDATECPPTFLTDPNMVQGVIAGGPAALTRSIEGAEDRPEDGAAAMDEKQVRPNDVVFGIATGGTTPFVHGAIARAKQLGAKTVFFACVSKNQVADDADVSIRVITGPEVLTGSTRMKAGTATKMVLNMVTTISMVRLGKVYRNLMVDVNTAANAKLVDRGGRIIEQITGVSRAESLRLLQSAQGKVKTALVMHVRNVDAKTAKQILIESNGLLSKILKS
ncbi:MAG: N-acetylmuramic acid 6-phosphate etherase [Planctomycetota bacterium]